MPPLRHPQDREIVRLALPALGALVAEPLYLLADSAVVGHLGTPQLAGLASAGAALGMLVAVFVFLAYGTTASVARRLGAGDLPAALRQGVDGMWLAAALGLVVAGVGLLTAPAVIAALGTPPDAVPYGVTYLRVSCAGIPAMLVVLAAVGVLRGLQDTRTPLVVAAVGAAANVGLNVLLVHGVGLGIAGAALGTVLVQVASAAFLARVVVVGARRHGTRLRPDLPGMRAAGRAGVPLVVRTVTLRISLTVATYVAARLGGVPLATHQVAFAIWGLLALTLDAIAIAGQAIVGRYLGAGDVAGTRSACRRMVEWGVAAGVVLGVLVVATRPVYDGWFSPDPRVQDLLVAVLVVVAVQQPLAGAVFVLDGVLIGAGDGRYLAVAGVLTMLAFLPLAALVLLLDGGLVALWWAVGGLMLARLATLWWRVRGDAWMVTGALR